MNSVKPFFMSFPSSILSFVSALLPKCMLCFSAYAGILSSFGVSATIYKNSLLPLTIGFSFLTLVSLGYWAKKNKRWGPLFLSSFAVILIVGGSFYLDSHFILYSGVFLLIGANLWNILPLQKNNNTYMSNEEFHQTLKKILKNSTTQN